MAEQNTSPWTLTSHPGEIAVCRGRARYAVTPAAWDDPELAALVAPPVVVSAAPVAAPAAFPAAERRPMITAAIPQPGRHRATAWETAELPTWRDLAGALAPA